MCQALFKAVCAMLVTGFGGRGELLLLVPFPWSDLQIQSDKTDF